MKKVGVVIPCYNYGEYLIKAVESVLASTYMDIDIVVVDDGSIDEKTKNILDNFNYPKCRLIRIANSGPANARNIGIRALDCEFILPLDADDYIHPELIKKAMRIFKDAPDTDIVYSKAEFVGDKEGIWELPVYDKTTMITENCIPVTAFFRKSMWEDIGGFNVNMIHGMEDYDFWLSFVERDVVIHFIDEPLFYYRIRNDSRSAQQYDYYLETHVTLFNNHRELFCDNIIELYRLILGDRPYATLFWDYGDGISAKNSIRKYGIKYDCSLELIFDLPHDRELKSLRFDPTEGNFSVIEVEGFYLNYAKKENIKINSDYITCNGRNMKEGEYFFMTTDPSFYINNISIKDAISIKVIYRALRIPTDELNSSQYFNRAILAQKHELYENLGIKNSLKLVYRAIKNYFIK